MTTWPETPIVFTCGPDELLGVIHRAGDGGERLGVLVVVGGPQYRVGSHRQFTLMARELAAAGFPTMRFDYRGMGDSAGEIRSFEAVGEDIRLAIEAFLGAVPSLRAIVLWGLCDAASALLMDGDCDPRVAGLIIANPWVRTQAGEARAYLKHYYGQRLLQRSFWGKIFSARFAAVKSLRDLFDTFRAAKERRERTSERSAPFIDRMRSGLAAGRRPILVLISERDLTAAEFTDLCERDAAWRAAVARPNVQVVRLAGADHTFSSRAALNDAVAQCRAWLVHLDAQRRDSSGPGDRPAQERHRIGDAGEASAREHASRG